ncbi:glycosyltransferase 61 family protein [Paracoccus sp. (in: a-proteobacteria)]|uniref:glycosyltransferase 61 family protein n=1 Tax=Paracoccus sp. TaxID=267 RepID=UPI0035B1C1F2
MSFEELPAPILESAPRMLPCKPALFDPDHLSRVTACAFGRRLQDLIPVLQETRYMENPLSIYRLGEATILGGIIVTKSNRIFHSETVTASLKDAIASAPVTAEAVVPNSTQGLFYFGHWLGDDVSAFEAFRDDPGLVSLPLPPWPDTELYRKLFDQNWRQQRVVRTRSLTMLRDLGFSQRKAERYRGLRSRLRNRLKGAGPEIVYLRRGPSGTARQIVNATELERRLAEAGIAILTPEQDGEHVVARALDAKLVISVEGSQACHAIYALRDAGSLLVLQPPDRFYAAPHEWMRTLDMNCGMVIGTAAEGGFSIDPDEVLQMVDRLLDRTENREAS